MIQEMDGFNCVHNIIFTNKFLTYSIPLPIPTSVYKYLFLGSQDIVFLAIENIHQIVDLLSQELVTPLSFHRHFANNQISTWPCIIRIIKLFQDLGTKITWDICSIKFQTIKFKKYLFNIMRHEN